MASCRSSMAIVVVVVIVIANSFKKKTCTDRLFPKMGECREVLGGGPAPPSKLETLRVQPGSQT